MMLLVAVISVISIFEVRAMLEKKLKKELMVFAVMCVITFYFGYINIQKIYIFSLINDMFNLLGIKY